MVVVVLASVNEILGNDILSLDFSWHAHAHPHTHAHTHTHTHAPAVRCGARPNFRPDTAIRSL